MEHLGINLDCFMKAWDKKEREIISVHQLLLSPSSSKWGAGVLDEHNDFHAINDIELMPWSGLRDKRNWPIFLSNIVAVPATRVSVGGSAWYKRVSKHDKRVTAHCAVIFNAPAFNLEWENPYNKSLARLKKGETCERKVWGGDLFHFMGSPVCKDLEVIGNIFEHGDLLTKGYIL